MKKYAFVIYRKWAFDIFKNIYLWNQHKKHFLIDTLITIPSPEFFLSEIPEDVTVFQVDPKNNTEIEQFLSARDIKTAFFYGWSWIIKDPLLSNILCLGVHPSQLPQFRGGSPLQHQILAGKTKTYASLFQTASGIDSGDIYLQLPLSLKGNMQTIFKNMARVGTTMTKKFILDDVQEKTTFHKQKNLDKFLPLKRRKPEESEIIMENLSTISFTQLNNFVRSLTDPYPNAYISLGNKKLKIQKIKKVKTFPKKGILLTRTSSIGNKTVYLKLKDSFAKIEEYSFEE